MRFLLALLFASPVQADPPSTHGMLLFGSYISHLPMFHAPHDYQLIAEVRLESHNYPADLQLYTLVPEKFQLPQLAKSPFPFKADVVRGHFERGGKTIDHVQVKDLRVIHFHKLDPAAKRERGWLLFGSRKQAYLAHLITGKPDFDQVVALAPVDLADTQLAAGVKVIAPDQPLTDHQQLTVQLDGKARTLKVLSLLYLEHGDLAE